jgi:cytochrome c oxidase subunit 2
MRSNYRRHFLYAGILVVVFTLVIQWILDLSLPLPVIQGSAQSAAIDNLIGQHVWLIAGAGALVLVIMGYSIVAFRARPGEEDEEGDYFHGHSGLEVAWTIIPLIVVTIYGVIGTQVLAQVTAPQDNEMTVEVEGLQWSWRFAYPDQGEFQTTEMVVPVNQPLLLSMSSVDVLHSFWVVEWRVKQDLVPGITTELRVTPTEVGEFQLRCAELCGLRHAYMLADVRVVSQEDFDAWIDEQLE